MKIDNLFEVASFAEELQMIREGYASLPNYSVAIIVLTITAAVAFSLKREKTVVDCVKVRLKKCSGVLEEKCLNVLKVECSKEKKF